uniref:Peptide deformylase n=1 Tax=Timema tahoe TaxID=61484 RepID=A0A7R9FLH5_9NEOP|nr:unnamed protein product [Timema tahoe]
MWKADELQDDKEQFLIRLTSSSSLSPVSSPPPISPSTYSQNFELPGPSTQHYFTIVGATPLEDRKKEISPEIYKLRDMSTIPLQVFINPKMKVQNYEKLVFPEGCESVRGFAADVPRYKEVTVSVKYHFIMLF